MLKIFSAELDTSAATVGIDGDDRYLNAGDTITFNLLPQQDDGMGGLEDAFNFQILGTTPSATEIELIFNATDSDGDPIRVSVDAASLGNTMAGSLLDFSYTVAEGDRLGDEDELEVQGIEITLDPADPTSGVTFDTSSTMDVAVQDTTIDLFVDPDSAGLFWNDSNPDFLIDTQPPTVEEIERPVTATDPLIIDFSEELLTPMGAPFAQGDIDPLIDVTARAADNTTMDVDLSGFTLAVVDDDTLSITPNTEDWVDDGSITYEVVIAAGEAEDIAGNAIAGDPAAAVFTLGGTDMTPPALDVVERVESGAATGTEFMTLELDELGSNLRLVVDEAVRSAGLGIELTESDLANTLTLRDSSGTLIPFTVTIDDSGNTTAFLIDPDEDLDPAESYTLTLEAGTVEDLAGNPNGVIAFDFGTAGDTDGGTLPPPPPAAEDDDDDDDDDDIDDDDSDDDSDDSDDGSDDGDDSGVDDITDLDPSTDDNGGFVFQLEQFIATQTTSFNLQLGSGNAFDFDLGSDIIDQVLDFFAVLPDSDDDEFNFNFSQVSFSSSFSFNLQTTSFAGAVDVDLPTSDQDANVRVGGFRANRGYNFSGQRFSGGLKVNVPDDTEETDPTTRRVFSFKQFQASANVEFSAIGIGLPFDIDSEVPLSGFLGAGGDIVELVGNLLPDGIPSLFGLGGGGDFFADLREVFSDLFLNGNGGDDDITGGGGDDTINGGADDDMVDGGAGDDMVSGDNGDDMVDGGDGDDMVNGGDGDDTVSGGAGDDMVSGDGGNDTIDCDDGDDTGSGGDGNDTVDGGAGNDSVSGDDGNDDVMGGSGDDTVSGGNGDDMVSGDGGNDVLECDAGDDMGSGGTGNDTVDGGAGSDMVNGNQGNDDVMGGADNDTVNGGQGDDMASGGDGDDMVSGDDGNDMVSGDDGDDMVSGGDGNDVASGDNGNDVVDCEAGDDVGTGGMGNDTVDGGAGNDVVNGNQGDDDVMGGADNDVLNGGQGDDMLMGGDGNDVLSGDMGDDMLMGGDGVDRFDYGLGRGIDTILDFDPLLDRLGINGLTFAQLEIREVQIGIQVNTEIVLAGDEGSKLILQNTFAAQISQSSFTFFGGSIG